MNTELPIVSIITPVFNGAQFIEELILSVKKQDYPNVEHAIVDDGSNDNGATIEILKRYPHLRWRSQPNQGQYGAMNEGLSIAKGDIICFISSDDVLLPGAIKAVIDFLESHPEMDGAFGLTGYMDELGEDLTPPVLFPKAPFGMVGYLAHVLHCSFYLKRDCFEKFDISFDPSLKYTGDYEWMIRIAKTPLKIGMVDRKLSNIRLHSSQTSQRYVSDGLQEIEGVYKKHGVNLALRRLVLMVHFFYYRLWELGQKYRQGGVGALAAHVGKFIGRLVRV